PRGRPCGPPGTGPGGPGHAARRAPLMSHPGQVLAGPSVDLDAVTLLHEERHVDDQAGLQCHRLRGPGAGVAFDPGLGVGDLQFDGGRQFDTDRVAVVHHQGDGGAVGEVPGRRADVVLGKGDLAVVVEVHEVVTQVVGVEELVFDPVDVGLGDVLVGAEGPVEDLAGLGV